MAKTEIVRAAEGDETDLAPIYEAAVKYVNEHVESEAGGLVEVGAYLLETFFDGDIEAARSQAPNKGLSIRNLAMRDDINMSYTRLSRCLNLAVQEGDLKSVATSQQLTASHKVLLLAVEDVAAKRSYAKAVESKKLSVRTLRDQLVADGHIQQRGMGALTEGKERFLARKGHRRLMRSFDFIEAIDADVFDEVDLRTAKQTLTKAKAANATLTKLIKKLSVKVGE